MPDTIPIEVPRSLVEETRRCISMLMEMNGALSREEYLFLLEMLGLDPDIIPEPGWEV